jgi:hypothetical protein
MIKKVFLATGLSILLMMTVFGMKMQSQSAMTEAELTLLPDDLRNAAYQARDTRLSMQGRTWIFAASGDTEEVTTGDVERAKMQLAMSKK